MADFPKSIYSPRTVQNRTGVVYDASQSKRFYAEDFENPANEIVSIENFLNNRYIMKPDFISLATLWAQTSLGLYDSSYMEWVTTGAVNNSIDKGIQVPDGYAFIFGIDKNPIFDLYAELDFTGSFESYLGMGDIQNGFGIGFKVTNTNIYIAYYNSSYVSVYSSVATPITKVLYHFRVVISYGSFVKWYINDILVYTLDISSVPLATYNSVIAEFVLTNLVLTITPPRLYFFQLQISCNWS